MVVEELIIELIVLIWMDLKSHWYYQWLKGCINQENFGSVTKLDQPTL